MGFLLSKLLPQLAYPLGLGLMLQVAGLAATALRKPHWGYGLSGAGIGLIWLFAMPFTSRQLIWALEQQASALTPEPIPQADAVVVLGGGLRPALRPRDGVEVAEAGDRLLTGLRLMRQRKAPVLVTSGGQVTFTRGNPAPPEAASAKTLAIELGLPAHRILTNPGSRTTAEEARDIGEMGRQQGWNRVLLVTSASHLPRALSTFRKRSGLTVIPVACDFQLPGRRFYGQPGMGSILQDMIPDAHALSLSSVAIKEHLGLALYRLKGWS